MVAENPRMLSRSARGNPVHLLVPIHVMLGDSGARQLGMRHCQCDAKPHLVGDTNPTREKPQYIGFLHVRLLPITGCLTAS